MSREVYLVARHSIALLTVLEDHMESAKKKSQRRCLSRDRLTHEIETQDPEQKEWCWRCLMPTLKLCFEETVTKSSVTKA